MAYLRRIGDGIPFVQEKPTIELSNNESHNILQLLPPGYRFRPTEEELVMAYLRRKIMNHPMPPNKIMEAYVYQCHPEQLSREYENYGGKEWYFFSPRDRIYPKGNRPKRSAQNGHWRSTGTKHSVFSNGIVVGNWRTLVFYEGDRSSCRKTNWIMREYALHEPTHQRSSIIDMKLDDWVLCKIYKNEKIYKSTTTQQNNHEDNDGFPNQEVEVSIDSSKIEYGRNPINNLFPELFEPYSQNNELLSQIPQLAEIPQDQLQQNTDSIVAATRSDDHTTSDKRPSTEDITLNSNTFPVIESPRLMMEPSNYMFPSQEDIASRITSSEMSQHCYNNNVATTHDDHTTTDKPPSTEDITLNSSTFPVIESPSLMMEPSNCILPSQEDIASRITSSEMSQHCYNNNVATTHESMLAEPIHLNPPSSELFTNPADQYYCNQEDWVGNNLGNSENFGFSPVNALYYDDFDETLIPWDEI